MENNENEEAVKIQKYDVVMYDFPKNGNAIQFGYRPAIVIQNDVGNENSESIVVIPLTSKLVKTKFQPTHCIINKTEENGLKVDSMLLAEQVTTVNKKSVQRIGRIESREIQKRILRCYIKCAVYGYGDQDAIDMKYNRLFDTGT